MQSCFVVVVVCLFQVFAKTADTSVKGGIHAFIIHALRWKTRKGMFLWLIHDHRTVVVTAATT